MFDFLTSLGRGLDPYAVIIQFVLWGGAGLALGRRTLRRRLRRAEGDIEGLKDQVEDREATIAELRGRLNKLSNLGARLPERVLARARRQERDVGSDAAAADLIQWFNNEGPDIAEMACRVARWHLSVPTEGADGSAAAMARRYTDLAVAAYPGGSEALDMQMEVVALEAEGLDYRGRPELAEAAIDAVHRYISDDGNPDIKSLSRQAHQAFQGASYRVSRALWLRVADLAGRERGPGERDTVIARSRAALALAALGHYSEAETEMDYLLGVVRAGGSLAESDVLNIRLHRARLISYHKDRREEARTLDRGLYDAARRVHGEASQGLLEFAVHRADGLVKDGAAEEAVEILRPFTEREFQAVEEPVRERVGQMYSTLAMAYLELGDPERALSHVDEALRREADVFDPGHPVLAAYESIKARVLWVLGRREEARQLLQQASEATTARHGPAHPVSIQMRAQLDEVCQAMSTATSDAMHTSFWSGFSVNAT